MKKILVVAAVVIVVIAVGAYIVMSNLDSFVAGMIEKYGSEATRTSVTVSGVDISLSKGRGNIEGLTVKNPEGFEAPDAFRMADITIDLDVKSIRGEPVIVEEVLVRAPVVFAEFNEKGESNINQIRKRVNEYAAGEGAGDGEEKPGKRMIIRKFVFEQGEIRIDATELGVEERTVTLPEMKMNEIGGESGAPPAGIAKIILKEMASRAASEVAESRVREAIGKQLKESGAREAAKDLIKKLQD